MSGNARGPAGDGASDERIDDTPECTPCDPPPAGFLDLGNGELFGAGTAADFAAAAGWLRRHYPGHSQDPPREYTEPVILNMGYELTREARAGMPRGWSMGRRAVVLILADICNDRTRRQPLHMDVSERLCEELDITPGTLRNILTGLAADGFEFRVAVGKDKRGKSVFAHRGHAVDYRFPEIPPRTPEGASASAPLESKGPLNDEPLTGKGASVSAPSGSKVHPSMPKGASVSAPQTPLTPNSKEDARSLSPHAQASADGAGEGERENDDFDENEDEEEPDPDFALLAAAVPGADWRDVENAVTTLQIRKHNGEIRTTVRGYLRKVIGNGDAWSIVNDAADQRRRDEADLARYGDPFAGSPQADPWAPANGTPVVAGEVVQDDPWMSPTPYQIATAAPVIYEPIRVACPECGADPDVYCRKPGGGRHAGWHPGRRKAAEHQAEEETQ